jgi:iron complex transport system ATP-binding protein
MTQREPDLERERITDDGGASVASVLVGDGLELSYPTSEEPVVECPRLDIPVGAVTGIVVPNGSGKSTLPKAQSYYLLPYVATCFLSKFPSLPD